MIHKPTIQAYFDQSATTYESVASVQRQTAAYLVQKIITDFPDFQPKTLLDIGAGTGFVTEQLLSHFPHAQYLLNDLAPSMLAQLHHKFPTLQCHPGDAEQCLFPPQDGIVSNLAFQWFQHLPHAIYRLFHHSKLLAFTTLCAGTFAEWSALYTEQGAPSPVFPYPTVDALTRICEAVHPSHLSIEQRSFPLHFSSAIDFIRYLKKLGAHARHNPEAASHTGKILQHHTGAITVQYQVFFAILRRE